MSLLDRIVERKREEVASIRLSSLPEREGGVRPFYNFLRRPAAAPLRVIAECKKASPSRGVLLEDYQPIAIARSYRQLGATAISVLTDRGFFQGTLDDMVAVRQAVPLPVLRKDFIIDERQIRESYAVGADVILLIVRLLDDAQLADYLALADELGLAVLVETHDAAEVERAIAAGSAIIGINHRNLDTLAMDLSLTGQLAPAIRRTLPEALVVAESGLESREGVAAVEAHADAVLVGHALLEGGASRGWRALFG